MKNQINLFILFIFCLLTACSKEDYGNKDTNDIFDDGPLYVNISGTSSQSTPSTRINDLGDDFFLYNQIGVFMLKPGEPLNRDNILQDLHNTPYICWRWGTFIGSQFRENVDPANRTTYPTNRYQAFDFISYAPYREDLSDDYIIPIDTERQPNNNHMNTENPLDLMYSNDVRNAYRERDTIVLGFRHLMSRLEVRLSSYNSDVIDPYHAKVTITGTGLKRTAKLNLVNGEIYDLGSEGDIVLNMSYNFWSRAFLIPQTITDAKLLIQPDRYPGILEYALPKSMKFEAGKYYIYHLRLEKGEIRLIQNTITEWAGKDVPPDEDEVIIQ